MFRVREIPATGPRIGERPREFGEGAKPNWSGLGSNVGMMSQSADSRRDTVRDLLPGPSGEIMMFGACYAISESVASSALNGAASAPHWRGSHAKLVEL